MTTIFQALAVVLLTVLLNQAAAYAVQRLLALLKHVQDLDQATRGMSRSCLLLMPAMEITRTLTDTKS